MKNQQKLIILSFIFIIMACGGNSEGELQEPKPVTPIAANDAIHSVDAFSTEYIDITEYIDCEGDVKLISVTSVNQDVCSDIRLNNNGFDVTLVKEGVCEIDYTAQSIPDPEHQKSEAQAKLVLISSDTQQADFSPISVALIEGQQIDINLTTELGADFPAGFTLSSDVTILGSGQVTVDTAHTIITYQGDSSGLSRLIYTFSDSLDTKIGYVDVSVSSPGTQPPLTSKFTHAVSPTINEIITVDLAPFVSDPDGDTVQLVEVMSFNASVSPVNPNDISNKLFTFSSGTAGLHYVSYMVSDHRGGFSSNLIEIEVVDPAQLAQWFDINFELDIFSAPLTQIEAQQQGVQYSGTNLDTGYSPAIKMANMTLIEARNYCATKGRLPNSNELISLATIETPNFKHNWPNQSLYLTDDAGFGMLIEFDSGEVNPIVKGNYYVTCISDGSLTIDPIDIEAIANGIDKAVINVELKLAGMPISGKTITASVTGSAQLEHSLVITNNDGIANFALTSLKGETVVVTFDYENQHSVSQNVLFTGDTDTAFVQSLIITKNKANTDGIDKNTLVATVVDHLDNPVKGALVVIYVWEDTADGSTSYPNSLVTDNNGEVHIEITNTQEERIQIRAEYTNTNTPPEWSYADAITYYFKHNTLSPIEAEGLTWTPPLTESEAIAVGFAPDAIYTEDGSTGPNGMIVSRFNWLQADDFCYALNYYGMRSWRLPTDQELLSLYNEAVTTHPTGAVFDKYNWPTFYVFWSSTSYAAGTYSTMNLMDGTVRQEIDNYAKYVTCVHDPVPVP